MQYDLDFLRRAYREEGVPISTDAAVPRDDVMFTDSFIYGTSIIVHPFMAYELIFRDRPAEWLYQIRGRVEADAARTADAAIARLERGGREDRVLIIEAELAAFERAWLVEVGQRADALLCEMNEKLRRFHGDAPGTITP